MKIAFAYKTVPMQGEIKNGDAVFAHVAEDGSACFCVIDALGHGPAAAEVADRAVEHLRDAVPSFDAVFVMRRMHDALRGSRGAAATVCLFKDGRLTACGVGNVTLRSVGTNVPFVLSPGILGARVQTFRGASAALTPGDRLVLHSDGLSSVFALDGVRGLDAQAACDALFDARRKTTDDATLLVVDVLAEH